MSRFNLFASLTLALSLSACGPEPHPSEPLENESSGETMLPAIDSRDFAGMWRMIGKLSEIDARGRETHTWLESTWTFDIGAQRTVLVPLGTCTVPALIEERTAVFEKGFRCTVQRDNDFPLVVTFEDGSIEWLHDGHLRLGLQYTEQSGANRDTFVRSSLIVAELIAPGHSD